MISRFIRKVLRLRRKVKRKFCTNMKNISYQKYIIRGNAWQISCRNPLEFNDIKYSSVNWLAKSFGYIRGKSFCLSLVYCSLYLNYQYCRGKRSYFTNLFNGEAEKKIQKKVGWHQIPLYTINKFHQCLFWNNLMLSVFIIYNYLLY